MQPSLEQDRNLPPAQPSSCAFSCVFHSSNQTLRCPKTSRYSPCSVVDQVSKEQVTLHPGDRYHPGGHWQGWHPPHTWWQSQAGCCNPWRLTGFLLITLQDHKIIPSRVVSMSNRQMVKRTSESHAYPVNLPNSGQSSVVYSSLSTNTSSHHPSSKLNYPVTPNESGNVNEMFCTDIFPSKLKGLTLCGHNVNHIPNKLDELKLYRECGYPQLDVYGLSETFLTDCIHDDLVRVKGYQKIRKDRNIAEVRVLLFT